MKPRTDPQGRTMMRKKTVESADEKMAKLKAQHKPGVSADPMAIQQDQERIQKKAYWQRVKAKMQKIREAEPSPYV